MSLPVKSRQPTTAGFSRRLESAHEIRNPNRAGRSLSKLRIPQGPLLVGAVLAGLVMLGAVFTYRRVSRGRTRDRIVLTALRLAALAVVVAVPVDALVNQSFELLRGGGQVLLFAHTKRGAETPVDLARICVDEVDLMGSYSADFTLQKQVAKLVFSRQLDIRPLITHRFPLAETAAAVELASNPTPESLKVLVSQIL